MPLGIIVLGSFAVLSDHGETFEDDVVVVVVESSEESTGTMPRLPLVSWAKERRISSHAEMHCGKFRKHCSGNDRRDAEKSSFFDCWDWRHEQSDILQHADPWARNAPKSISGANGCTSVNFPTCSVSQKLGVCNRHVPATAPQCDIPREGQCRPDEVSIEVTPCEEWLLDEVELNTVTISNIDRKLVETDGKRGQH